jgi:hypothetical protein
MTRKYLPTFGDLVDRLAIVQLKAIHIDREAYNAERALIEHDIDLLLRSQRKLRALDIRALLIIMLANVTIWNNESKAREGGNEQDKFLKFTHSVNGLRSRAKNILQARVGGRQDQKVDCLAADMPKEFGNWRLFE